MEKTTINMKQEQFWKIRSKKYNNLKWVHEPIYIFKKAYNMKIVSGDCLIDVKNLILVGEK